MWRFRAEDELRERLTRKDFLKVAGTGTAGLALLKNLTRVRPSCPSASPKASGEGPLRQGLRAGPHLRLRARCVHGGPRGPTRQPPPPPSVHRRRVVAEAGASRDRRQYRGLAPRAAGARSGVEDGTKEGFRARRQLERLLVVEVTVGKKLENGETEVRITYRFGPPPASGASGYPSQGGMFGDALKNGRESFRPDINTPTLTVVAVR